MHLVPPTDPVLWTPAAEVTDIAAQVTPHLTVMRELARAKDGVALAAPQVGLPLRFFVVVGHFAGVGSVLNVPPYVAINPVILSSGKRLVTAVEGCLSFPGHRTLVQRAHEINVRYEDEGGNLRYGTLVGMEARVFAHEFQHLSGSCIFPLTPATT